MCFKYFNYFFYALFKIRIRIITYYRRIYFIMDFGFCDARFKEVITNVHKEMSLNDGVNEDGFFIYDPVKHFNLIRQVVKRYVNQITISELREMCSTGNNSQETVITIKSIDHWIDSIHLEITWMLKNTENRHISRFLPKEITQKWDQEEL